MRLAASLICRNELSRYLAPCIEHLRAFCDLIVVVDDASDDGTREWLEDASDDQLRLVSGDGGPPMFYRHEGRARTVLLEHTLACEPTNVLSLDADEFVTDGPALRKLIEEQSDVQAWHLPIEEVWAASEERILHRVDGGWATGRSLCWKVPDVGRLSFPNRALACGRVPIQTRMMRAQPSAQSLLHVGWLDESERVARHARYTEHDKGRFHASAHLASILWPPERIKLEARAWPDGLLPWRDAILEHAAVKT